MAQEPGSVVGGRYRLEKPLAKGGMGSVWLARHTELDALVAVKFMARELVGTPVAEMRFKREAKAAAQLRSPHVVQIHDYGVQDGAPYMVMELLDGEDLGAALEREGTLPIGRVAAIIQQVAKALGLAHAAGIVHRDLKPANLFLQRNGDDEIVKVLDFGVAKETTPTLVVDKTTSGMLVGSPQYMSPEQARGESVGAASDLWSLGVVVYEALVGRPPFVSTHLGALLAKIHEAVFDAPTAVVTGLPGAIDGFMRRALARQPEARFASAKALADELSAIAQGAANGEQREVYTPPEPVGGVAHGTAPTEEVRALPAAERSGAASVGRGAAVAARSEPPPGWRGRAEETLPAGEADPVSTTMHERAAARATGSGRSKGLIYGGIAGVVLAAAGAVWIGSGGEGRGDAAADPSGAATGSGAAARGSNPDVRPAGDDPARGGTATGSGPASAGSAAGSGDANGSAAAAGSATTSGAAAGSGRPGAGPARTAGTGTAATSATGTGGAKGGSTGAATATASAKATAAPVATPTYDPTFGLPPSP